MPDWAKLSEEEKEKWRAYGRAYHYAHREKRLAYSKEYDRKSPKRKAYRKSEHYKQLSQAERKRNDWKRRFKYEYGLSWEDYEKMAEAQGYKCAICGEGHAIKNRWGSITTRLFVDHDHTTGKIRGLLCYHCNVALGHLRDDPQRISKMLAYLNNA